MARHGLIGPAPAAGQLITTEAMVAEKPGQPGAGGMPDTRAMDGMM